MRGIRKQWFGIQPGERRRAWLMFAIIYLVIAALTIVKPVRNSLFLHEYGADQLPYAFLLVALVSSVVAFQYSRLTRKFNLHTLIQGTLLLSVLLFLLFWYLLNHANGIHWITYVLYVWVAIFGLISTTQFWLLANYVFFTRQAKRLFGFLGAGAIGGGITGGYLTRFLAEAIGTRNMLFFCVAFLLIASILVREVWTRSEREIQERLKARNRQEKQQLNQKIAPFKRILQSRHLTFIAALVGVGVLVANLVDFQFSAISVASIHDEDQLTAFFGFWLSNLSILSLLVQLILTNRLIARFGVGASLYLLPAGILLGSLAVILSPVLWAAVLVKVSDGSFKQSVNKVGLEMLYLPVPAPIKNQTKAIIDMFIDHLATGVGGLLLIILTQLLGFGARGVSLLIVALVAVWFVLIRMARTEYVASFRIALEKRSLDIDSDSFDLDDATIQTSLLKALDDPNPRKVLYILDLLSESSIDPGRLPLADLLKNPDQDVRTRVFEIARRAKTVDLSSHAKEVINRSHGRGRVAALTYLIGRSGEGTEILKEWTSKGSVSRRRDAILALGRLLDSIPDVSKQMDVVSEFQAVLEFSRSEGMAEKDRSALRTALAQAIGEAGDPALHTYLHTLLHETDRDTLNVAVQAAGKIGAVEFVPALIKHLDTKLVRRQARESLAMYGKSIIPQLIERIDNPLESQQVRYGIARVLGMIGSQDAVDVLIQLVKREKNLSVKDRLIRSLNRLKDRYPQLHFTNAAVDATLYYQIEEYYTLHNRLSAQKNGTQGNGNPRVKQARNLLVRSLEERLDRELERIFRLLGLRYSSRDINDAYQGINSKRAEVRDNAVEFLDNLLDNQLKKALLPIIEDVHSEEMIAVPRKMFGIVHEDEDESLLSLAFGDDPWLSSVALFLIAQYGPGPLAKQCLSLIDSPNPLVQETALYLQKLCYTPQKNLVGE